jgi:hypothetical protein
VHKPKHVDRRFGTTAPTIAATSARAFRPLTAGAVTARKNVRDTASRKAAETAFDQRLAESPK